MKFLFVLTACSFFALCAAAAPTTDAAAKWTPQFATYLGGSNLDAASAIALDGAGDFYVAGVSNSPNFPGAEHPPETKRGDAFLCKFSPSFQLLWTRFVGGSGFDQAHGVAVNKTGDVYLVGDCENGDIPLLGAPSLPHGQRCAFLARFSAEGELRMATLLGGSGSTNGEAIVLDGENNIWIAGTMSGATFPTKHAQLTGAGKADVWVSKLAPSGELLFTTILGGSEDEALGDLILAPSGGVALAGTTASTNFPVVNAMQPTFGGAGSKSGSGVNGDAWVAVLDAGGKTRWATYFGGRSADVGGAIAFAPGGDLWLTGSSASRDLPLKNLLPEGDQAGGTFVARLKGDGSQLLQSTFVPGAPSNGTLLSVEPKGDLWLGSAGGYSSGVYQLSHLNADATKILDTIPWPTDRVDGLARGGDGTLYLAGAAYDHLPTRRALMETPGGGEDGFVAVLKEQAPTAPNAQPVTLTVDAPAGGLAASGTTNVGEDGEVQVLLYRSADSKYWTRSEWNNSPAWLLARVKGERWTLAGLPQGANLPPGDYYLHAVAVTGAQLENFLGAEYSGEGRAKASRKIVIAP